MIPTLQQCVDACYGNPEFMREYRRLMGSDFGRSSGIAFEIDMATGHFEAQARRFIAFVYEFIFTPLVADP